MQGNEQWGNTSKPINYTAIATFPLPITTYIAAFAIGLVVESDMTAKAISVLSTTATKTNLSFRTQVTDAPTVKYLLLAI